jgi:hypothetical protein
MTHSKFASITASLLARKGEARPWTDPLPKKSLSWKDDEGLPLADEPITPPPFVEVRPTSVQPAPRPCDEPEFSDLSVPEPARPFDPERIKKCTIRMSFIDYERLGIIAVKKNVTRQHLLHEALERCFQMAVEEYRQDCACLGNRESCCQS